MATTLENLPLSVGLSVAKLRSVISSLAESVDNLQAQQLESDEKFKEFKKEIELTRAKEINSDNLTSLSSNTLKVDSSALSLENAKLQRDLEEAVHIIESKTQAIESLNKRVLVIESDLAQKDKELSQKNSQLKNVDMMVSVFQKNMASVRSQFSEVQERFHKEQVSADKLKRTHDGLIHSQKMYQEDINKLTLENKMKQMKIKTQEEKIADVYSKLREQAMLLEETKLKLQSETDLRNVAEGFAEEVRKEKEFFCESLKASERLLTDTTHLLRQREDSYNDTVNEKVVLEKHIEELKRALDEKINPVECTEHKATIQRLEEQVKQLNEKNKELTDKVQTYQSRELVLKEEVILQDKKVDKTNEELQSVSKSLQSYKDLSVMQEKKLETLQSELESHKTLIVRLEEELLKADKKTTRPQPAPVVSNSPPKPVVPPTQSDSHSPLSVGGRKFFTPPLPRPTASSPVQKVVRPALVYAEEDESGLDGEDDTLQLGNVVADIVPRNESRLVRDDEELQEDLFVLDFDMPNKDDNDVPDQMDLDTDNEDYDFDAFRRASSMYPSTNGKQGARSNHLPTSSTTGKRKNNLDDFIQVTPRGRPAQSKPAQQVTNNTQHANNSNTTTAANTMRAPIGPSFSTYKYKQTTKKSSSASNAASDVPGCCADQHKHGPTIQCTSCRKKFHYSCLRQNDNRTMIKEPFTCSSCANKRKPRAKK